MIPLRNKRKGTCIINTLEVLTLAFVILSALSFMTIIRKENSYPL